MRRHKEMVTQLFPFFPSPLLQNKHRTEKEAKEEEVLGEPTKKISPQSFARSTNPFSVGHSPVLLLPSLSFQWSTKVLYQFQSEPRVLGVFVFYGTTARHASLFSESKKPETPFPVSPSVSGCTCQ